ncbi:MAG: hypothetical protein ACRC9V_05805 [Aeromonas sp.]
MTNNRYMHLRRARDQGSCVGQGFATKGAQVCLHSLAPVLRATLLKASFDSAWSGFEK